MAENKTKVTEIRVSDYIAGLPDPIQRLDSAFLIELMQAKTGAPAKMWGPSIIGFGDYHYTYESGREGDFFLAGFAPRSRQIVVYLNGQIPRQAELLRQLGPHKMGKGCLYIKRLDQIDRDVLTELISESIAAVRAKYPGK